MGRQSSEVCSLFFLSMFLLLSIPAAAQDIIGRAEVVDGDTIKIAGERIRLHGIDAPERRQTCRRGGEEYACGVDATKALSALVGDQGVACRAVDRDRYGRTVAKCFAGGGDINNEMVRQGWAIAYRKYSIDYVAAEVAARATKSGLWAGQFMLPWEWRKTKRAK